MIIGGRHRDGIGGHLLRHPVGGIEIVSHQGYGELILAGLKTHLNNGRFVVVDSGIENGFCIDRIDIHGRKEYHRPRRIHILDTQTPYSAGSGAVDIVRHRFHCVFPAFSDPSRFVRRRSDRGDLFSIHFKGNPFYPVLVTGGGFKDHQVTFQDPPLRDQQLYGWWSVGFHHHGAAAVADITRKVLYRNFEVSHAFSAHHEAESAIDHSGPRSELHRLATEIP